MKKRNYITICSIILVIFLITIIIKMSPKIDFEYLYLQKDKILEIVELNYILSSIIFLIIYIISVSLSIPIATVLSILGGFLFGLIPGIALVVLGTTTGSMLIFLLVRNLASNNFQNKYAKKLINFNSELDKNGANYLLSLRLIPLFPFTLVSILAGLSNLHWKKFLFPSLIGILPISTIYCYIGFSGNVAIGENGIISKEIFISLGLLCLVSLIPLILKKIKKYKTKNSPN